MEKKSKILALIILIVGLLVFVYNKSISRESIGREGGVENGIEKSIENDMDTKKDRDKIKKDNPEENNSNSNNLYEDLAEKSEKELWKETWKRSDKEMLNRLGEMDSRSAISQCNVYKICIEGCENTPVNLSSKGKGVQIESKELNYSNDKVEVDIKFPKIQLKGQSAKDTKAQLPDIKEDIALKINKEIEDYTMAFKNKVEKGAAEYKKQCDKGGEDFNIQVAQSDYKVTYNSDDILSIVIEYYEYTGGAHGMTYKINFNYYIDIGERIKLSSLFKEGFNYKEHVDKAIKEAMDKTPEVYFGDKFQGINDDTSFYITKEGVVIYFPLYEIAPYSTGIPEFIISM
ncbi:DUF3298 and DUF4163 domain-containing protein [Clostridium algidicarnis]|uniref:DUF3298 and DUF4163 domain-containing protein n=1 Tax=Clostridium algidicarnis TaxID=37659 RepID=UPI001C0CB7D0|nr:DUF3298 and DUF4163 domain-containing protein [Clostridium algidicarnis]MBU3209326.1 DUF3298 and DUF4163 domain-containing protein [Clostridium algidicarnis]MBU3228038.1 DUF3298 and DUF4163 domain-containing protein [Clostridium algidicarnis]MBU3251792.1 DUF3298 and DUF4163 domain-containing protein [Clostridium algidicarnis]